MRQLQKHARCGRMIPVALSCLATVLSGCAETPEGAPSVADNADAACELLIDTINSVEGYREANFNPESRIAGSDGGEGDAFPGYAIMRLNAVCREDICGSVMIGWYAVDLETGRVWEWDINNDEVGEKIASLPEPLS